MDTMKEIKEMNEMKKEELSLEELSLEELEQVNGGFLVAAWITALIGGAITAAIVYHETSH